MGISSKNNMNQNKKRAPEPLYNEFRNYFPFSTIDLLVIFEGKFLLSKRLNQPYKNMWHLPGGMIRKGEKMLDAVKRIGIEELQVIPKIGKFIVGDSKPYNYLISSIEDFYNQDELLELIKKNKFYKSEYRNLSGGVVAIHSAWKV